MVLFCLLKKLKSFKIFGFHCIPTFELLLFSYLKAFEKSDRWRWGHQGPCFRSLKCFSKMYFLRWSKVSVLETCYNAKYFENFKNDLNLTKHSYFERYLSFKEECQQLRRTRYIYIRELGKSALCPLSPSFSLFFSLLLSLFFWNSLWLTTVGWARCIWISTPTTQPSRKRQGFGAISSAHSKVSIKAVCAYIYIYIVSKYKCVNISMTKYVINILPLLPLLRKRQKQYHLWLAWCGEHWRSAKLRLLGFP